MKWVAGAAVAALLLGGGYYAWKSMAPGQSSTDLAYNDPSYNDPAYDDGAQPLRASPGEPGQDADDTDTDQSIASSAATETPRTTAPRRSTVRSATVPEETIGIMPVSAAGNDYAAEDEDDIVVTAARRPIWSRTPTARRLSALYPQRALDRGREGEASLHCTVQQGGALNCVPVSQTPGGFGNAALRVARTFRHATQLADGSDATGTPVNLRVVFRMPEEERRG